MNKISLTLTDKILAAIESDPRIQKHLKDLIRAANNSGLLGEMVIIPQYTFVDHPGDIAKVQDGIDIHISINVIQISLTNPKLSNNE